MSNIPTTWKKKDSLQPRGWREDLMGLVLIYRMLECGDQIPINTDGTDYSFVEGTLQDLYNSELICVSKDQMYWEPTQKAADLRNRMVQIYDQLLQFEIFGSINLNMDLPEDMSDDGAYVFDQHYDPRFEEPKDKWQAEEWNTQDLRLTMIDFLHYNMKNEDDFSGEPELNKHRIVFFQMLSDGEFNGDVLFDLRLGKPFDHIEEIVKTAYPWTALSDDADEAEAMMRSIYTAGMLERRKRDGHECSGCGIPLSVFELNEKENGRFLTQCPNPDCGLSFIPPEPEGDIFECPNCNSNVGTGDHQCRGCGAALDFSMSPGSIVEETTEEVEEEPVWHDPYYDYTPYGWYNPYDPYYDIMAFGVVCAVLW